MHASRQVTAVSAIQQPGVRASRQVTAVSAIQQRKWLNDCFRPSRVIALKTIQSARGARTQFDVALQHGAQHGGEPCPFFLLVEDFAVLPQCLFRLLLVALDQAVGELLFLPVVQLAGGLASLRPQS